MPLDKNTPHLPAWVLFATVFVTGASILVIELIGTRVLAPFFGSGIYTWSALIAVTLAALAVGYSVGGGLADRSPRPAILYYLCLVAGGWTLITPWLATQALPHIASVSEIRLAVLLSSVLLFFPNLFALGMASPFAIRLFSSDHETSGRTSGRVFAASTLGSLLAALLTGFFLVPTFGVLNILTFCGAALMLLALFGFIVVKRLAPGAASLLLVITALSGVTNPVPAKHDTLELVDSSPSFYGHVQVVRRHGLKLLLVNGILQNEASDQYEASLAYLTFFSSLPLIKAKPGDEAPTSLVVGLGAGQLPMMLKENGVQVEAVEIDPVIETMARRHFALDMPTENLHFTDGRLFLQQTDNRYDYIFLDAFNADQMPWHLLSTQAMKIAQTRLNTGGMLALNTVSLPGSEEVAAVYRTLGEVFPHVRAFNQSTDQNLSNIVFLASDSSIRLLPYRTKLSLEQTDTANYFLAGEISDPGEGIILSDDYNPINHLHEAAQEQWRKDMLAFLGNDYYNWAFY